MEVVVGAPEYVDKGVVTGIIKGWDMYVEMVNDIGSFVPPMCEIVRLWTWIELTIAVRALDAVLPCSCHDW